MQKRERESFDMPRHETQSKQNNKGSPLLEAQNLFETPEQKSTI